GRADTTHANLRLTSRPLERLRVSAEYRSSERDNESGRYDSATVPADSLQTLSFVNPAYSFANRDLSLAADYRFSRMLKGAAAWQRKGRERDDHGEARNDEDVYWGRLRFRPMKQLSLSFRGESGTRDATDYQVIPGTGAGAEQNPRLRKYYQADRDRDLV